jgi:hypothetical protein
MKECFVEIVFLYIEILITNFLEGAINCVIFLVKFPSKSQQSSVTIDVKVCAEHLSLLSSIELKELKKPLYDCFRAFFR